MLLTKADLKLTYAVLKAYSKLRILPIQIDTTAGQIQLEKKQWNLVLWQIGWYIVAFHAIFKNIRLLQVFLDPEKYFVFAHFPIHLANAMIFAASVYYTHKMFVQRPAETVITFNETNDFSDKTKTGDSRGRLRKLLGYSLQELILVGFLPSLFSLSTVTVAIFSYDPVRSEFLYSILPENHQRFYTLIPLLLAEFAIDTAGYAAGFGVFLQLCFFRKCISELGNGRDDMGPSKMLSLYRRLQVLIGMYNQVHQDFTFFLKIACITVATTCGFAGIAILHKNLLVGTVNLFLALYADLAFCLIYDKAFDIPMKAKALRMLFLRQAGSPNEIVRRAPGKSKGRQITELAMTAVDGDFVFVHDRPIGLKEAKKIAMSFRTLGVKVGNFKYLERASTPEFLDFVVQATANLLITFT